MGWVASRWIAFCCILSIAVVVLACSEAPINRAAKHETRDNGYVQQDKFREAAIEYQDAVRVYVVSRG